jgi:hypothetical protein
MIEGNRAEGLAPSNNLCWVHTKWGRHQAQIIMETMQAEGHYVIVRMINDAFELSESVKVFTIDKIEYI